MKYGFYILFMLVGNHLLAQTLGRQSVATAGLSGSSSSYTVGQAIASTSVSAGSALLIAGFQQPALEGIDVTGLDDISVQLSAFPNPSSDFITISGSDLSFTDARVSLMTLEGKRVSLPFQQGNELTLDVRQLPSSVYWLYIEFLTTQNVASFKLIKN